MSFNCLEIENFTPSLEYYNILKNINEHIIIFTKSFKKASMEYKNKLKDINIKLKSGLESIKQEKIPKNNKKFNKVIYFIDTISKIFDIYLENFGVCLDNIGKGIKSYDPSDSDLVIKTYTDSFQKSKKKLLKTERELQKLKNNFMEKMTETERYIYNYYYFTNHKTSEEQPKKKIKT